MSAYNSPMTDGELRELFREKILAGDGDDAFTDKFIEMQSKAVFAAPAAMLIPVGKEQELLTKLGAKSGAKIAAKVGMKYGMKWIFTSLSCAAAVATATVVYKNSGKDPQPQKTLAAVTAAPEKEEAPAAIPAENREDTLLSAPIPAITPGGVTKQTPEQLTSGSPFTENILPVFPKAPEPAAAAAGPVEAVLPASLEAAMGRITTTTSVTISREATVSNRNSLNIDVNQCNVSVSPQFITNTGGIDTSFSGVKSLKVSCAMGNITIMPSHNDQLTVRGTLGSSNKAKTEEFKLSCEQKGSALTVSIEQLVKRLVVKNDFEYAELNFEVPDGTTLDISASDGDIHAYDLRGGNVEAATTAGDIRITNCETSIIAKAANGTVDLNNISGNVAASSSFGDVIFSQITGNFTADVASGNFVCNMSRGNCLINSQFGDITFHNATGTMDLYAQSGNITIDSLSGEKCQINSTFGDVYLNRITAPVKATVTSGNFHVDGITGSISLESSFGDLDIRSMAGNLTAEVNSGNSSLTGIRGDIELTSHFGDVTINGSNGSATITANSGNVSGKKMQLTNRLDIDVAFGNSLIQLDNNYEAISFDLSSAFGKVKINKGDLKLEKENGAIVLEKGGVLVRGNAASGNITFN